MSVDTFHSTCICQSTYVHVKCQIHVKADVYADTCACVRLQTYGSDRSHTQIYLHTCACICPYQCVCICVEARQAHRSSCLPGQQNRRSRHEQARMNAHTNRHTRTCTCTRTRTNVRWHAPIHPPARVPAGWSCTHACKGVTRKSPACAQRACVHLCAGYSAAAFCAVATRQGAATQNEAKTKRARQEDDRHVTIRRVAAAKLNFAPPPLSSTAT